MEIVRLAMLTMTAGCPSSFRDGSTENPIHIVDVGTSRHDFATRFFQLFYHYIPIIPPFWWSNLNSCGLNQLNPHVPWLNHSKSQCLLLEFSFSVGYTHPSKREPIWVRFAVNRLIRSRWGYGDAGPCLVNKSLFVMFFWSILVPKPSSFFRILVNFCNFS